MNQDWGDRKTRQKFYNSKDWKVTRMIILTESPFCCLCALDGKLTPANVVDHIIDIKDDPSKRLDHNNLRSVCTVCHNRKTAKTTQIGKEPPNKKPSFNLYKRKWKIPNVKN